MTYIDIMSSLNYKTTRISRDEARKLIAKILQEYPASVIWTKHGQERLLERGLTNDDIYNILVSPHARILDEGEVNDRGIYSYRLQTNKFLVVVSFSSDGRQLSVVTAFRKSLLGGN